MMRRVKSFLRDTRGAAAAEMALILPLLLIILFGSLELGNYFMDEHRLVQSVRDGARFAARQNFTNYPACSGSIPTEGVDDTPFENTHSMVRKGTLSSTANDLLPKWDDGGTTFSISVRCESSVNGSDMLGIYRSRLSTNCNGGTANGCAQVVTVTASLPYQPILQAFGFTGSGFQLNATSEAAVTGI